MQTRQSPTVDFNSAFPFVFRYLLHTGYARRPSFYHRYKGQQVCIKQSEGQSTRGSIAFHQQHKACQQSFVSFSVTKTSLHNVKVNYRVTALHKKMHNACKTDAKIVYKHSEAGCIGGHSLGKGGSQRKVYTASLCPSEVCHPPLTHNSGCVN